MEIIYVVDNNRNSAGSLASWSPWTRRRLADPSASGNRSNRADYQLGQRPRSALTTTAIQKSAIWLNAIFAFWSVAARLPTMAEALK